MNNNKIVTEREWVEYELVIRALATEMISKKDDMIDMLELMSSTIGLLSLELMGENSHVFAHNCEAFGSEVLQSLSIRYPNRIKPRHIEIFNNMAKYKKNQVLELNR